MNKLHHRIIEISRKLGLAHLGSCLTSVDAIDEIYSKKRENEKFVLSNGHAGLALYVILEKYYGLDAEKLYLKHGMHPNRDLEDMIYCSTGSLGMGLMIALGMALSDRGKDVYCLISDGECFEGSVWEAANVIEKYLVWNLKLYVIFNGFSAYDEVGEHFQDRIKFILPWAVIKKTDVRDYGLEGISAHYIKL